jgi:histidinol phosphatase-like enzyme (inositol monophosphatase family)
MEMPSGRCHHGGRIRLLAASDDRFWENVLMATSYSSASDEFRQFASGLADAARAISLPSFRHDMRVHRKADDSPVTAIDRSIETMMRERIAERYPHHGILGEEHGRAHTDAEYVWVLDPIDGTQSFISGWPLWGCLIALLYRDKPLLGLVDIPVLDERWLAESGGATLCNQGPARTRACARLQDATIYCTSPDIFSAQELAAFDRVSKAARARRFGGDCYSYAMLASGHLDAVIESNLQPYDYLAMAPVIEGAGGIITDWQGQPLTMRSRGQVVAAGSAELHAEIVAGLAVT